MTFALDAIVGSTEQSLTDGAPFALMSARGMAGPPIRRVTARGPQQHGDTDLGYRLQPREIELEIGFAAANDAILDGHRDTLVSLFKPLTNTPVNLRVTRDDDIVRQIDVFTVGQVKIDLLPEYRAAHYHRATIRLRAPDPTWYDPTPGTASVTGSALFAENWWLAGGAIGTAQVLMHGTAPGSAEAWSYAGTILAPDSTDPAYTWTLAVRNAGTPNPALTSYMFVVGTANTGTAGYNVYQPSVQVTPTGVQSMGTSFLPSTYGTALNLGTSIQAGTANYFLSYLGPTGGQMAWHAGSTTYSAPYLISIEGTPRVWRSGNWTPAIERYALYNPKLSDSQRAALDTAMSFGADPTDIGTINTYLNLVYEGNMPEYPVISITGPISDITIFNSATTRTLQMQPFSIGAGTTVVIDLRYGRKSVLEGTINHGTALNDISDLDSWALAPSPIGPNGLNQLLVYGDDINSNSEISVVYYKRYASY